MLLWINAVRNKYRDKQRMMNMQNLKRMFKNSDKYLLKDFPRRRLFNI
jgi:hypothetical protein